MRIDRTYFGGVRGGSLERRADAAGFDGQPVDRNGLGESADRIEAGIAVLASDPHARRAFAFANRAMSLQRLHTWPPNAAARTPGWTWPARWRRGTDRGPDLDIGEVGKARDRASDAMH